MCYIVLYLLILSIPYCISQNSSLSTNCNVTFELIGTSFNLCPLQLESGLYYDITDTRNVYDNFNNNTNKNDTYKYYFNIGDSINLNDTICTQNVAWAYQVIFDSFGNKYNCYKLSDEYGGSPPKWSLIHSTDPGYGIQLTYSNGDNTGCNNGSKNRKFHIQFICDNSNNNYLIPNETQVFEYTECEYTIQIHTVYGCPTQCKINEDNNKLCSGKGLCGYDFENSIPHCFCYYKYYGNDCSKYDPNQLPKPQESMKSPPNPTSDFVKTETIGNVTVIYDLSEYAISGGVYLVYDIDNPNYLYYTGIPDPVIPPAFGGTILPAICQNIIGPCYDFNTTTGS